MSAQPRVDQTALRFQQASIIILLLLAFIVGWPWLVAIVGLVMLVGAIWPAAGLFRMVYQRLLQPVGLLKPKVIPDSPHPHLFAQGVGGLVLAAAVIAFLAGLALVGWALAWVVILLAAINLLTGFCLGCFLHYQLSRLGVTVWLPTWR